jgi:hypothetical protein
MCNIASEIVSSALGRLLVSPLAPHLKKKPERGKRQSPGPIQSSYFLNPHKKTSEEVTDK